MHYAMWVIIALSALVGGMLYRGNEDIANQKIIHESTVKGAALFLIDMTPRELSEVSI